MSEELRGSDYVACGDLHDAVRGLVAAAGDTCEDVDPRSLPWLLEQGLIRPVIDPAPPSAEERDA